MLPNPPTRGGSEEQLSQDSTAGAPRFTLFRTVCAQSPFESVNLLRRHAQQSIFKDSQFPFLMATAYLTLATRGFDPITTREHV